MSAPEHPKVEQMTKLLSEVEVEVEGIWWDEELDSVVVRYSGPHEVAQRLVHRAYTLVHPEDTTECFMCWWGCCDDHEEEGS